MKKILSAALLVFLLTAACGLFSRPAPTPAAPKSGAILVPTLTATPLPTPTPTPVPTQTPVPTATLTPVPVFTLCGVEMQNRQGRAWVEGFQAQQVCDALTERIQNSGEQPAEWSGIVLPEEAYDYEVVCSDSLEGFSFEIIGTVGQPGGNSLCEWVVEGFGASTYARPTDLFGIITTARNIRNPILFQDDFSDPGSGWDRLSQTDTITDYWDGIYRFFVGKTFIDIWANPGLFFTDVRVEVDATKAGGTDDNDFGVICRSQTVREFYFFVISSDGYYGIGKIHDEEQAWIGMAGMEPSTAIQRGAAVNHIRADCVGSTLTLYVNGELIDQVADSDYAYGDVGLLAGAYAEAGVDIHFDNFTVRQP